MRVAQTPMTDAARIIFAAVNPMASELDHFVASIFEDSLIAYKDFGDGMYAAVVRMFVNDRLVYGSIDDRVGYDRYWCYDQGFPLWSDWHCGRTATLNPTVGTSHITASILNRLRLA